MPSIDRVTVIHDGWGRFLLLDIRETDGTAYARQVEDHGAAVAVLPYDPDRRVVTLVRQFRAPVLYAGGPPVTIEAPAGILEAGSSPQACARREAVEETGLHLETLEPVGTFWTGPGFTTERLTLFLAAYRPAQRLSSGGGLEDEHERIEVIELPFARALAMVAGGEIADMKTVLLLRELQLRLATIAD